MEVWPLEKLGQEGLKVVGCGDNLAHIYGWYAATLSTPVIEAFKDRTYPVLITTDNYQTSPFHITLGTRIILDMIELTTEDELNRAEDSWNRAYHAMLLSSKEAYSRHSQVDHVIRLTGKVSLPAHTQSPVSIEVELPGGHQEAAYCVEPPKDGIKCRNQKLSFMPVFLKTQEKQATCTIFIINPSNQTIHLQKGTTIGTVKGVEEVRTPEANNEIRREDLVEAGCATTFTRSAEAGSPTPPLPAHPEPVKLSKEEKVQQLLEALDLSEVEEEPPEVKQQIYQLFTDFEDIFSLGDTDLGEAKNVQHVIRLEDHAPFKERYRRIPPHQLEEVKTELRNMLEVGVIKPSESPWTNAVVLVRKKGGALRLCIDFRKLNARTLKDAYALPRIDEVLDSLSGSSCFSALDLRMGFWQTPLEESSKQYTAFTVGPLGFYEFQRMPFGLTNAPATFQRLMENSLRELHLTWCLIYLDDIVVYSKTLEDQITRLRGVFLKLREANLKLKPSKCNFFKKRLHYLGHIVDKDGIHMDPAKVEVIKNWPAPKTVTGVRQFIGLANQYRRFIKDYSQIAKPMRQLICNEYAKSKSLNIEAQWQADPEIQDAFDKLKKAVSQAPVLAYADFGRPFRLVTDASTIGLGAALYQVQEDGKDKPIAFASRALSKSEQNYPAHKLEFLALKWAVTQKFKDYLYAAPHFEVCTDNNPLTYVLSTAKLDATGHRWIAELASYNFSLKYLKGTKNVVADALSRIDWHAPPPEARPASVTDTMNPEAVKSALVEATMDPGERAEALPVMAKANNIQGGQDLDFVTPMKAKLEVDWKKEQEADPVLRAIRLWLSTPKKKRGPLAELLPTQDEAPDAEAYKPQASRYRMKDGLLYRIVDPPQKRAKHENTLFQFMIPRKFRAAVLTGCHDDAAHLGTARVQALLRERFYWPTMYSDAESYCKNCRTCVRAQGNNSKEPLCPIVATQPGELYHVDFCKIEAPEGYGKRTNVNVMVVTDHFTRFSQAYLVPSQTAKETAGALWTHFDLFGIPARLLTDQGSNFTSKLLQEVCSIANISKLRTSPHHPEGNGQVERFNRTLYRMLAKLPKEQKDNWDQHLGRLVSAYNRTRHATTGYSPFFLFYGRRPRLELDMQFPQNPGIPKSKAKFIQDLEKGIRWAHELAAETAQKEMNRQKRYYDKRVRAVVLQPGDLVLLQQEVPRTRFKLRMKWEEEPYEVLSRTGPQVPVYKIKNTKTGRIKTVHRNKLLTLLTAEQPAESKSVGDASVRPENEPGTLAKAVQRITTVLSNPQTLLWNLGSKIT